MFNDPEKRIRLLRERLPKLYDLLDPCTLCPRQCMVARREGEAGECGIADKLIVSTIGLHHGNEYPISGTRGSGNIFASGCNLHCVYCQNWGISQGREGRTMSANDLATAMLQLSDMGAHNINCVSPSHVVPLLMDAYLKAIEQGLRLPFVYNTGGYDSLETLQLLDGIVDIYLPDMKYADADIGQKYSDVVDYPRYNQAAVKEMHRQVGPLVRDEQGVAISGVLVRHLVLPEDTGQCGKIFDFLESEIPGPVYVNIMAQYRPCYKAASVKSLSRPLQSEEYLAARAEALQRKSLKLIE
ncbi:radical SAM protein [candidate division KSB1 bacterium]|nr:MAG: radical SAM protein [candidate division KSB1 bacterium]